MLRQIKVYILFIIIGLSAITISAQSNLSWEVLTNVSFEEKILEDTETYWMVPKFGEDIKLYENQEVIIGGYLIPIDLENNFCVLSSNPYTSCFFCGGAGPESIVELQFKEQLKEIQMDQRVRIIGKLKLNKFDIDHFNYILKNARIINE